MAKKRIKVSFPHFGKYTALFKESLERLSAEVVLPPNITDRTKKRDKVFKRDDVLSV